MSELRDVVAAVLTEHRHKSPRVQARLVVEAIDGKPRRPKPRVAATECRCAEWAALAVEDKSIQAQTIDAAEAEGRLKPFAAWLLDAYVSAYGSQGDRVGRHTG